MYEKSRFPTANWLVGLASKRGFVHAEIIGRFSLFKIKSCLWSADKRKKYQQNSAHLAKVLNLDQIYILLGIRSKESGSPDEITGQQTGCEHTVGDIYYCMEKFQKPVAAKLQKGARVYKDWSQRHAHKRLLRWQQKGWNEMTGYSRVRAGTW